MMIHADSLDFAAKILGSEIDLRPTSDLSSEPGLDRLTGLLYPQRKIYSSNLAADRLWRYLFMVEKAPVSQYDVVVDLCQQNIELPHGLLCLAGSGEKFHGLRDRSWTALSGNIHLTAHLIPNLRMTEFGIGFTIISALSVVDTIDRLPGLEGRAMIKWVNDIFVDNAKVSGFLTHTLSLDGLITAAIIGIGLNVETTPSITPDRFISRAVALCDLVKDSSVCNQRIVFEHLMDTLEDNYAHLAGGRLSYLLDRYRQRSMIIGREVEIVPDSPGGSGDVTVRGRVAAIGPNLELFLDGRAAPVTRGRLSVIA